MRGSLNGAIREPLRFSLVGVVNTVSGLAVIYLLKWAFNLPDLVANAVGYAAGILVSFVLNGRWTFTASGSAGSAFPRFLCVVAVAYCLNLACVAAALRSGLVNGYVAQALGVVPYVVVSFVGMKYFVYRQGQTADTKGRSRP